MNQPTLLCEKCGLRQHEYVETRKVIRMVKGLWDTSCGHGYKRDQRVHQMAEVYRCGKCGRERVWGDVGKEVA